MSFAGPRGQTSRRQLLLLASLSAVSAATSACSDAKTGPQEPRHSPATAYPGGTGPTDQASATTGAGTASVPPRVLIVGAGAAGIAAAQRLVAAGVSVEILEARDRIGGRVHTTATWPDLPVDIGASWIHGHQGNPVTEWAAAAGARTLSTSYDSGEIYVAAALRAAGLRTHDADRWEAYAARALREAAKRDSDISIDAAIRGLPEFARLTSTERADLAFYLTGSVESEWGADVDAVSAWTVEEGEEFGGEDRLFPGGFSAVLAHAVQGVPVTLSTPVRQVRVDGPSVRVTTDAGVRTAEAVVLTVPLGVLQAGTIRIEPGWSASGARALEKLAMGVLSKTFVRFDSAFWPAHIDWHEYLGLQAGYWAEWVSFAKAGVPVILGFNAGSGGRRVEAASPAVVASEVHEVLRDMFGGGVPAPRAVLTSTWSTDEWARGSYSVNAVGSTPADRSALARPIAGRIFIAGEATEPDYHSTVHGAVISGRRAAAEVLDALR